MATTANALDGLLFIRDGSISARWNFPDAVGSSTASPAGIGNAVGITYSFPSTSPSYISVNGFLAFDVAQKQAVRDILASIGEVANIDFIETSGVVQMSFAMSSQSLGQGGYAYTPSYSYYYSDSTITSVEEQSVSGDVWLNRNADWDANAWQPGHDGHATLLHEIGHALGLKHPFESGPNGYTLVDSLDDESHTVMSYTGAPHSIVIEVSGTSTSYSWQETFIRPSTLMPLDIEALQYLYGANTSTRTGNDVYQWARNAELLETIWDGGGIDTIDCSNQIFACIIDLIPGSHSSIALRQTDAEIRSGLELPSWFTQPLPADTYNGGDNLAIAAGVVLEKAIGGAGDDQITGNAANNTLNGGGGADRLGGNGGNDSLDGGTGIDTLLGGTGNDVYIVNSKSDIVSEISGQGSDLIKTSVTYSLADTDGTGSHGGNVEKLTLTGSSAVNGTGNSLANTLTGNAQANILKGQGGNDALIANGGNDILYGGSGNDVMTGNGGIDKFVFDTKPDASTNLDTINDFTHGSDKIVLDHDIFVALGMAGTASGVPLTVEKFHIGPSAQDALDRIAYHASTGALYYDIDGSGTASAPIQFALLGTTTHPTLSATDFLVIA